MAQSPNQFGMSVEKGMLDLKAHQEAISVLAGSALVAGQLVKLVDSGTAIPTVTAITADTDDVFGVVPYELRRSAIVSGERLELVIAGIVYMEASAAIARGAQVMPVVSGEKVATAAGSGKRVIGRAFDKPTANGALFRVRLNLPGAVIP